MFAHAHVQIALQLVQTYKGELPFVHFSKQYFSAHKKHGSRDRKQILQLCYCWFRLGHTLPQLPPEQRIFLALFLCSDAPNGLLENLAPDWNGKTQLTVAEKCLLAGIGPHELNIFPWTSELSEGIEAGIFSLSHLQQPDLFIRIRPGFRDAVIQTLESKWISYILVDENTVRLPTGAKLEDDFVLNKQVVVQDLNSQKLGSLFSLLPGSLTKSKPFRIWDACAASGGKSIMAMDSFPHASLTVTDKRSSILFNLTERFKRAGIKDYHLLAADLEFHPAAIPMQHFIIADLPCTGSGTWSRTPEQLGFFDPATIALFSILQRNISGNALKNLLPGGYFLYITCSVFRQENEGNIVRLQQEHGLQLIKQELFSGYTRHADSMFAALLLKPGN